MLSIWASFAKFSFARLCARNGIRTFALTEHVHRLRHIPSKNCTSQIGNNGARTSINQDLSATFKIQIDHQLLTIMLGAIIGDIVGSRFEFNNTNKTDFEFFAAGCDYTDDTICTIAVADAIVRNADFGETLQAWCRRYPHPKGAYGGSFIRWVQSRNPQPYGSYGNGSAMRVSPGGWL